MYCKKNVFILLLVPLEMSCMLSCAGDDQLEVFIGKNPAQTYDDELTKLSEIPALPTDITDEDKAYIAERVAAFEDMMPQYTETFSPDGEKTYIIGYTDLGLSVYWATQNLSHEAGILSGEEMKTFRDFFNPDDYKEALEWHDAQYYLAEMLGVFNDNTYPLSISYNDYITMLQQSDLTYSSKSWQGLILEANRKAINSHNNAKWAYDKAMQDYTRAVQEYKNYLLEYKYGYITEHDVYAEWGSNALHGYPSIYYAIYDTDKTAQYVSNEELDAAANIWGSQWHTPTKAQFEELYTKCTFEEVRLSVKQGYESIRGYKVTGPSGRSIFMPTAGVSSGRYLAGEYITCDMTGRPSAGYGPFIYSFKPSNGIIDYHATYYYYNLRPIRTK